jgi:hypothetical protein
MDELGIDDATVVAVIPSFACDGFLEGDDIRHERAGSAGCLAAESGGEELYIKFTLDANNNLFLTPVMG